MNKSIKRLLGLFLVFMVTITPLQGAVNLTCQKNQEACNAGQDRAINTTSRMQSILVRPVNYVFGEEDSTVKTVFYATVGGLVLAGGLYGAYCYGVYSLSKKFAKELSEEAQEKLRLKQAMSFLLKELGSKEKEYFNLLDQTLEGVKIKFAIESDRKKKFEQENYVVRSAAEEEIFMAVYMPFLKNWRELRDAVALFEAKVKDHIAWRLSFLEESKGVFKDTGFNLTMHKAN